MRCIHSKGGGRCEIQETKPFACALYPFLLIATEDDVVLGVDLNCPKHKEADEAEALEYIKANTKDAAILDLLEVEFYGFNVKLIGRITTRV
jgi:Fe-S-cluster containining protein